MLASPHNFPINFTKAISELKIHLKLCSFLLFSQSLCVTAEGHLHITELCFSQYNTSSNKIEMEISVSTYKRLLYMIALAVCFSAYRVYQQAEETTEKHYLYEHTTHIHIPLL